MASPTKQVSFVEMPESDSKSESTECSRPRTNPLNIKARRSGGRLFVDHHQMELARLRAELRLSSFIVKMAKKPLPPNTPNIWNGLKPYFSTRCPEFVGNLPNDTYVDGKSRFMVHNIVDPEENVRIEQMKVTLPSINLTRGEMLAQKREERLKSATEGEAILNRRSKPVAWSQKEGSTHLTPFAKVRYQRPEIARRKGVIDYTDVNMLRRQMDHMYSANREQKHQVDFSRTSQDFYRMDLNVARDRAHPLNRFLLDQACVTYLGPSRGSIRAYKKLSGM